VREVILSLPFFGLWENLLYGLPKKPYRLFDHRHIHARIYARTVRTVIDDAVYGNRVDILDAEGQVAFARHGDDAGWPKCGDATARHRSAVYYFEV
jgi:hypothetical protein